MLQQISRNAADVNEPSHRRRRTDQNRRLTKSTVPERHHPSDIGPTLNNNKSKWQRRQINRSKQRHHRRVNRKTARTALPARLHETLSEINDRKSVP